MNAPLSSPSSAPSGFPAPRVVPNLAHAFGGVWRLTSQRFFTRGHWITLVGMLGVLTLFALGASATRSRVEEYVQWSALFYVCFLVPIMAFISGAGIVRDDLKAGTIDYVFTRPVPRAAFVVFRYVAHVICTQINFLFALAVVTTIGAVNGAPDMMAAVPRLLLTQALVIGVFSAFGFLCGVLTSRYVILGLVYGAIVEIGVGSVPTQLNRISMLRHATEVLQPLLGGERIGIGGPLAVDPLSAPAAIALLLGMTLVMLAATAALFASRELAGASGRDT